MRLSFNSLLMRFFGLVRDATTNAVLFQFSPHEIPVAFLIGFLASSSGIFQFSPHEILDELLRSHAALAPQLSILSS